MDVHLSTQHTPPGAPLPPGLGENGGSIDDKQNDTKTKKSKKKRSTRAGARADRRAACENARQGPLRFGGSRRQRGGLHSGGHDGGSGGAVFLKLRCKFRSLAPAAPHRTAPHTMAEFLVSGCSLPRVIFVCFIRASISLPLRVYTLRSPCGL